MARRTEFFVHPLLYDALSGGFYPNSDPGGPKHTLGRLAYAAFQKGKVVTGKTDGVLDARRSGYLYNPSWAPTVDIDIFCDGTNRVRRLSKLFLVARHNDEPGKIAAELIIDHDLKTSSSPHAITIYDSAGTNTHVLDLATIGDTQLFVAQRAQQFFESI